MNDNDENSLHHEYSQSVTDGDQKSITLIMDYILEQDNPFNMFERDFLLNCTSLSQAARDEFYKSLFNKTTVKLSDTIPKTRRTKRRRNPQQFLFMMSTKTPSNIDNARLRNFEFKTLLKSEIS